MAHTLSDFKKALAGGGARPNLFEVAIPDKLDVNINYCIISRRTRFSLVLILSLHKFDYLRCSFPALKIRFYLDGRQQI